MARTFKVEIKDGVIDQMVATVKKAAQENGIDFKGDSKSGHGGKAGASIDYVVNGTTVTITVDSSWFSRRAGWDDDALEREVRSWIKPYLK